MKARNRSLVMTVVALWTLAAHAGAPGVVELKNGDRTVTVTEEAVAESTVLHVAVSGGAHEGEWDYKDLSLDHETEPAGAPAVETLSTPGGTYLLVHAYSGGASCCWSLLMFNLDTGKVLGERLTGASSIQTARGKGRCLVEAKTVPIVTNEGGVPALPVRYCFDGVRFKARRQVSATAKPPGA